MTSSGDYKGMKLVNIEQVQIDELRKELGIEVKESEDRE